MDRQMDEGTSGKHYVSSLAGWRHKKCKNDERFLHTSGLAASQRTHPQMNC